MPTVAHKRGTRAALVALAGANGLVPWQIYSLSDEAGRIAIATSVNTFSTFALESEAGGGSADPLDLSASDPAAPGAGVVRIFGRNISGRMMPAFKGPSGLDTAVQSFLARNKVAWAQSVGNTTTLSLMGIALSAIGTATVANVALTNIHTAMRRLEYAVTTASTTAVAGWRDATAKYNIGDQYGGFHYICRFGPSRGVAADATRRFFNGLTSVISAPTDVNPSTVANCVGVGADTADTNYHFMHRTGTGTVVKVDTGIPKSSADTTEMYELAMFTPPGGTTVQFRFERLSTGDFFEYTATADLPAKTTLLAPRGCASVGGTSSVVGISLVSLYIETDY